MRAKEAYMEQKQRHAQAHETNDKDMWKAKGAQDDARAMFRRTIMSEQVGDQMGGMILWR